MKKLSFPYFQEFILSVIHKQMAILRKRRVLRKRGGMRKKRMVPRRKGFRPARNVPELASCSVNQWIGIVTNANVVYNLRNIALAQFPRAASIAENYQHYRIKKVTLEFLPSLDTFSNFVGVGTTQVPYLTYLIDKSGSIPNAVDGPTLRQMGAKPVRFDDKKISVSWRPSVLTETFGQANAASQYRISPWLSTNANALNPGVFVPSDIDHLGIFWKLDRNGVLPAGIPEYQYEVRITAEFQFKKPLAAVPAGTPESVSVTMPVDLSGNTVNLQV